MNADVFENWLTKNIVNFQSVAGLRDIVLVLDNAPYHGRTRFKIPRAKNAKRQQMIDFMDGNGIEYSINGTKAQFDSLIENFISKNPELGEEKEVKVLFFLIQLIKPH